MLALSFRVSIAQEEKHKSIAWEEIKNAGPDLKQIGWLKTKHANEIKSSNWSVGCETLDRDYAKFSVYKNYVGELGVKHARLQSGWAKCEKQKGVYDFAWLDSCVYGLIDQGVKPWICLCYGNTLYKSRIELGAEIFTSEEIMTAWCKYVEATVLHYKAVVKDWEIWNEPRHSASPEAYANLLIRTSGAIRKSQSNATILGFTVHGFTPGIVLKFPSAVLEILKAKGKLDVVDYVTYHPYTPNPDDCYPMVEELRQLLHSYNPRLKLYQGESGCPSMGNNRNNKEPWTEYSQVKWNLRRLAGDWTRNIPSSLFTIIDLKYPDHLQSLGLIRSNDSHEFLYKRTSFYGAQHMFNFFDSSVKSMGEMKYKADTQRKMYVAGFRKKGTSASGVMIWYNDNAPDSNLKWDLVNVTICNIRFKDPVYVELITGKVYEIGRKNWQKSGNGTVFTNLPVWDSPVMLDERGQIVMMPVNIAAKQVQQVPGKMKVVQCWDDSPTTDIPLVALLKKYHARATFNIIPRETRKAFVVRKMKAGEHVLFSFLPKDVSREGGFKVEHLANSEMHGIYEGFKIAGHCGIPLGDTPKDSEARMQILQKTKTMIRDDFGQAVCGYVYPGGNYSPAAMKDIGKAGYLYARTTKSADAPLPLDTPMALPTSCHWGSPTFWEKYEDAKKMGGVFYFWGHSCELGDDPELWAWLGSIYERISADPEAEWADVIDLFNN